MPSYGLNITITIVLIVTTIITNTYIITTIIVSIIDHHCRCNHHDTIVIVATKVINIESLHRLVRAFTSRLVRVYFVKKNMDNK